MFSLLRKKTPENFLVLDVRLPNYWSVRSAGQRTFSVGVINACLSSPSEDTSVVVNSSPELYADPKIALLDGESIRVTLCSCFISSDPT